MPTDDQLPRDRRAELEDAHFDPYRERAKLRRRGDLPPRWIDPPVQHDDDTRYDDPDFHPHRQPPLTLGVRLILITTTGIAAIAIACLYVSLTQTR